MKYIGLNVKQGTLNTRLIIAFPEDLVHAEVARSMQLCCRRHWQGASITIYSAGSIDMGEVSTFGSSESLGLEADPEDARYLLSSDYGGHRS